MSASAGRLPRCRPVDATHLEEAHTLGLAVQVVAQIGQQPAPERGAHHVQMLGDGVLHPDGITCRPEAAIIGAVDEAEVDDFLVVTGSPAALERQRAQPCLGSRAHGDARLRRPGRDVLIAVQADHFLDQVLLDGDVEAPRRRRDLKDRIR